VPEVTKRKSWPRRWKRWAQRLLLAALPVCVVLLVFELALRLLVAVPVAAPPVADDRTVLKCEHDSMVGWILPPGRSGDFDDDGVDLVIDTNAWGLRGPDYALAADTRHIVVLGDSYAFGWGVQEEEAFPRRLEVLLRRKYPSLKLTVINSGLPGYGPYQQRRMLQRIAQEVRPDLVISTFSLANDPVDEIRLARYTPDRLHEYTADVRDPKSWTARFLRSSRILSLVNQRTQHWQTFMTNAGPKGRKLAAAAVNDLIAECRTLEAPVLLVVIPQRNQIRGGGASWLTRLLTGPLRRLPRQIAEQQNIPVLDVTDALLTVHRREDVFLPYDAHWTAAGHEAVARAIVTALPDDWLTPAAAVTEPTD